MSGKLLSLITLTINLIDKMLLDPSFNEEQKHFLQSIPSEARAILEMLGKLHDVGFGRIQKIMDFESRSHLNNIIGYCDALLDEEEGTLTDEQRETLKDLNRRSYAILNQLPEVSI